MGEKNFDLEERFVAFAANTVFFCSDLPRDMPGQYYGNQLLRSSGSSALNFGEMQGAQSDKDFKNKASISLKELKESRLNLKILAKVGYGDNTKREHLLNEVDQLVRIMATIIKNKY
ncbi:four helix bundle protein [uncultured Croceitalea sp.]|uniref:four helix bundle protein n=1 Tax=uncultured Croceitalea sp. TaxID=1798908 RepID=UPI0033064D07